MEAMATDDLLTPDDIRHTVFSCSPGRDFYDAEEVDEFLDRVASTMVRLEATLDSFGLGADPLLERHIHSGKVERSVFDARLFGGVGHYRASEVDALLDEARESIIAYALLLSPKHRARQGALAS